MAGSARRLMSHADCVRFRPGDGRVRETRRSRAVWRHDASQPVRCDRDHRPDHEVLPSAAGHRHGAAARDRSVVEDGIGGDREGGLIAGGREHDQVTTHRDQNDAEARRARRASARDQREPGECRCTADQQRDQRASQREPPQHRRLPQELRRRAMQRAADGRISPPCQVGDHAHGCLPAQGRPRPGSGPRRRPGGTVRRRGPDDFRGPTGAVGRGRFPSSLPGRRCLMPHASV